MPRRLARRAVQVRPRPSRGVGMASIPTARLNSYAATKGSSMRKPGEDNAWRPQTDVLLAFLGCPATKEMSPWRGSSRLSLLLENDPSRTGGRRDGGRRVQAF